MADNPKFVTYTRSISNEEELQWGGDSETSEPWTDAIDTSTNITVTDDGTIKRGSDIPASGISHYEFEQDYTDSWASNDFATVNSPSFVAESATGSYAVDFDMQDKVVDTDFAGPQFPLSIAIWVKWSGNNPDKYPGRPLYFEDSGGGGGVIQTNTGDFTVNYNNGSSNNYADIPAVSGSYYHVVLTIESGEMKSYADGTLENTNNAVSLSSSSAVLNYISAGNDRNSENGYDGVVDAVKIYDKVLTDTEVSNLYNNERI